MSKNKKSCALCRSCCHEDGKGYVCHNENSEYYSLTLENIRNNICDKFKSHNFNMSNEELIESILSSKGSYRYYKYSWSDNHRPFLIYEFENNEDLDKFMDAQLTLFTNIIDKGDINNGKEGKEKEKQ